MSRVEAPKILKKTKSPYEAHYEKKIIKIWASVVYHSIIKLSLIGTRFYFFSL